MLKKRRLRPSQKYNIKASKAVFEIAGFGMYALATPTRHGLADMFENTGLFSYCSSSVGYSYHQIHFRSDGRVVNHGSEKSMFRQVLIHPRERLM
ncbi:hypothetical protein TNCV_2369801 [Trichonephila clavipes]|nr:hypothetical protein TNCV_2369801 [Trichonephila clavipes]